MGAGPLASVEDFRRRAGRLRSGIRRRNHVHGKFYNGAIQWGASAARIEKHESRGGLKFEFPAIPADEKAPLGWAGWRALALGFEDRMHFIGHR